MIGRLLKLTTPPMRGRDVEALQALLTGRGTIWGDFHPGGVDGEYGPLTANAVFRAKYWLGYATPNHVAGGTLTDMLNRTAVSLPHGYRLRRRGRIDARKQAQAEVPIGERVVRIARGEVGTREHPDGSNRQKYGAELGENGVPWCAIFALWCWKHAGLPLTLEQVLSWDYVPQLHADAVSSRGLYLVGRSNVREGDIVGLYHDGHVEIFDRWTDRPHGKFRTVGGNTTAPGQSGSQSDGGHVADPVRDWNDVSFSARFATPAA